MKIASIIGARPQFIKATAVSLELRKYFDEIIIHTGQHYDENMSANFFKELSIPEPDFNLNIGSGSHAQQTGNMLIKIGEKLEEIKPDIILVYGDTNSTLAGALAGAKMKIPLAHVEAGLRSYNRSMPEEINRVVTDHVASLLFCPTQNAVDILKKEGISEGVFFTGDVMYDLLRSYKKEVVNNKDVFKRLNIEPGEYFYLTLHRAENTDKEENLRSILDVLGSTGEKIIFPIHPRTKSALEKAHIDLGKNIKTIDPLGYLDNLTLQSKAKKILTDSGGIQKEAYFLKVPCITLREETEWVETLADGWNILVGADKEKIEQALKTFEPKRAQNNYFGKGQASVQIVKILKGFMNAS